MIEPDWAGMALEDARDWVQSADPELWFEFWQIYDEYQEEGRDFRPMIGYWITPDDLDGKEIKMPKDFLDRRVENQEWLHQLRKRRNSLNNFRYASQKAEDEYYETRLAYLLEVRRKLKLYVAEEYKKLQEEREKEFLDRRTLELPPRMLKYYELE